MKRMHILLPDDLAQRAAEHAAGLNHDMSTLTRALLEQELSKPQISRRSASSFRDQILELAGKLTQAQIARKVGCSQAQVSRVMSGER